MEEKREWLGEGERKDAKEEEEESEVKIAFIIAQKEIM